MLALCSFIHGPDWYGIFSFIPQSCLIIDSFWLLWRCWFIFFYIIAVLTINSSSIAYRHSMLNQLQTFNQTFNLLNLSWNNEERGHTWPLNCSWVSCPITFEPVKMAAIPERFIVFVNHQNYVNCVTVQILMDLIVFGTGQDFWQIFWLSVKKFLRNPKSWLAHWTCCQIGLNARKPKTSP